MNNLEDGLEWATYYVHSDLLLPTKRKRRPSYSDAAEQPAGEAMRAILLSFVSRYA